MTTTTQDRIERQIDIDAPAEKVWGLISTPGWWINEGVVGDNQIERQGDLDVVRHEKWGEFAILTVLLDAPRHAAFRWMPDPGGDPAQGTLTEFWIEDRDGGVVLKVSESGFDSLDVTEEKRRAMFADNSHGWTDQVKAAKAHVEGR